jgi:hypothetical protein
MRLCPECHKEMGFDDGIPVCPWTQCWDHPCTACWDAHLAMHVLAAGNESGIVQPYYKVIALDLERRRCSLGELVKDS